MKNNKKWIAVSITIIACCLVAFPFIIPSGALSVEANRWYVDNTREEGAGNGLFEIEEDAPVQTSGEGAGGSMEPEAWQPTGDFLNILPMIFSS